MPWLNVRKADPKRCKYTTHGALGHVYGCDKIQGHGGTHHITKKICTDNSRRVHPGYEKRYPSYKRQHEGT
jgi:hypothetical protein